MNYTDKYHLPQWEETDRIMRTDFNQMCADMEAGLAANAEAAGGLAVRIDQVEQEARDLAAAGGSSAKAALSRGLLRAAYHHMQDVAAGGVTAARYGSFFQTLDAASVLSGSGILRRTDHCWAGRAEAVFSSEDLKAQIQIVSAMKIVKDAPDETVPLVLAFTPTGAGQIGQMFITGNYKNAGGLECKCKVELKNLTSKVTETSFEIVLIRAGYSSGGLSATLTDIMFHGGCSYQLTVTPLSATADVTATYNPNNHLNTSCYNTALPAVLSCTFQEMEGSEGGVAALWYDTYGPGGTLKAVWDGEVLEPAAVRTITDSQGRTLKEAEFRKTAPAASESRFEIRAECAPNGEFLFYSWGGVLI